MLRLLLAMSMLGMAVSGPRERVMVKYKVKDGVKGERIEVINDKEQILSNNIVETDGVTEKGTKSNRPSGNEYKEKAKFLMGQLQKAARSGDL